MKTIIYLFLLISFIACKKKNCSDIKFTDPQGNILQDGMVIAGASSNTVSVGNNDCRSEKLGDYSISNKSGNTFNLSNDNIEPGEAKPYTVNFNIATSGDEVYLKKRNKVVFTWRN